MNERVLILRDAVVKITQMLSGKGIKVTQRGVNAYVKADARGVPVMVNLPYLPDNASEELCMAIQGFLDHEVAHIMFSDFTLASAAAKESCHSMLNMLEDARIEKAMAQKFSGCGHNLSVTGKFFLDKYTTPMMQDAAAAGDANKVIAVLMVPLIRAMAGQHIFKEYLKDKMHIIQPVYDQIADLEPKIEAAASTQDCFELAKEIEKRLRSGKKGKGGSEKGGDSSEEGGEVKDAKGKTSKKDEKKSDEKDEKKSGSKSKKKDEEKEEKDEKDESEGKGEGEKEKSEEKGESEKSDEKEEEEGEGEGKGGEGKSEEKDEEKDEEKPAPSEEEEEGEADDEGAGGGEGEGEGEDEQEGSGGSDEGSGSSDEGGAEEDDSDDSEELERNAAALWDEIDKESANDFDKSISRMISDEATDAARHADYLIYTKEEDKIEPLHVGADYRPEMLKDLADKVEHMVGPLQKDLERAIAARSLAVWENGRRSGRLASANLARLAVGDTRVFRRKHESTTKDVAVELVIDASGSMSGAKVHLATQAAYALSSVLERIGIKHEVICFTTGHVPANLTAINEEAAKIGRSFTRIESLNMPIIKSFNERLSTGVKERFGWLPNSRILRNNIDGECIEIAARRLLARKETGKVMIVLSDGAPNCRGDTHALSMHLKKAVKQISKAGVNVVGMGIMTDAVRHYYPKNLVIQNVSELPDRVMKELRHLLVS